MVGASYKVTVKKFGRLEMNRSGEINFHDFEWNIESSIIDRADYLLAAANYIREMANGAMKENSLAIIESQLNTLTKAVENFRRKYPE